MPREPEHPLDGIAAELEDWMAGEVDYYVEALKGGHRAPFSASITRAEQKQYFMDKMFEVSPDGRVQYDKPNREGRSQLIQLYGPQKYAEIWDIVKPKQGLPAAIAEQQAEEPEETDEPVGLAEEF